MKSICLPEHRLKVVVIEPEIPQNTGNIARLCAVTGAQLHLVRPLGFMLSGRHMKRSGMDYLENVDLVVHDNLDAFEEVIGNQPRWLFTAHGTKSLWDVSFTADDWLIFGRETAGLPAAFSTRWRERCVRIPMREDARCINLATSAGIAVYEGLRQITGRVVRSQ